MLYSTLLPDVIVDIILSHHTIYTEVDAIIQDNIQQHLSQQLKHSEEYSLLHIRINEFFFYNYYWFDKNDDSNIFPYPYLFLNSDYDYNYEHEPDC